MVLEPVMCIRTRPIRNSLVMLILTSGVALADIGCASSKLRPALTSRSHGHAAEQRRDPPTANKPKARPGVETDQDRQRVVPDGAIASVVARADVKGSVSTLHVAGTTGASSSGEPPPATVVTTTTKPPSPTEFEQSSRRLWPFLVGAVIAGGVALILLFRPTHLKAR